MIRKALRKYLALLFAPTLVAIPHAAHAAWYEASSAHFVIYADDSEKDIRSFAADLERFRSAMEFLTGRKVETPSPSNRVTIFVVGNTWQVKRLYGKGGRYVGGFYRPRAGGSVAFVPRIRSKGGDPDFSLITLLHEYAHHFMHGTTSFSIPRWYSEGGAEYFSSAKFERDGTVWIGMAAQHRAAEIYRARDVKVIELLDPETYEKTRRPGYDAFYGKSWLLFHYLVHDKERSGQVVAYLKGMTDGATSIEAARAAFGDIDRLEKDLDDYLAQRRITAWRLSPHLLSIGPIAVRRLRAGEEEVMPVRIRSRRGVSKEEAAELVVDAREIAARHPGDPAVLSALAEAEFDSGNFREAIAAADRALAIDPKQVKAYVQKGFALFALAEETNGNADGAYQLASQPFLALNKIENDHPLPLIYFYRSFVDRGATPPKIAVEGLEWASVLAPFDLGLRMEVANRQLFEGRLQDARRSLEPIAYNPHGGSLAEAARQIIERIDTGGGSLGAIAIPNLSDDEDLDEVRPGPTRLNVPKAP